MSGGSHRYGHQFRPEFSRIHLDRDLRWVVPFPIRYVVAVTGKRFAGKSAALAYLSEKKGFDVYSLATVLREQAISRGIPLEPRSRLQDLGDELRAGNNDPALLARLTLRRIHREHLDQRGSVEPPRRIAVGGFKRLEELRIFENLGTCAQLNIDADEEIRVRRAIASGIMAREVTHIEPTPELDAKAFREYIERRDLEGHDNRWTDGFGQAVGEVVAARSAIQIANNESIAALDASLDEEIRKLDDKYRAFLAY